MKKIYLMATAMLSLGMVCAQQNNEGPTSLNLKQNPSISIYQPRALNIGGARCTQNPLFTETFDDPFNDGWTTSGDGSSGNTYNPSDLWLHDYDGPSGFFSNSSERIVSTTLSDGFMILDGDYFNGLGGQPAPGSMEDYQANLVSPVYDLSGVANVSISFEHAYRICCSPSQDHLYVEISTDGFNNIHASYVVSDDVAMNDASGSITKHINITNDIQLNPATTQIRFRWGISGSSDNASHYWWQIDDFIVYETYQHHAELDTVRYTNSTNYGLFGGFGKIPSHDAAVTNLTWSGYLLNVGYSNWTDAKLEVLKNGNAWVSSASQAVSSLTMSQQFQASGQMASAIGTNTYTVFGTDTAQMCIMDSLSFDIEVTQDAWSAGGSTITGIQSGSNWVWNTPPVRIGFGGEVNIVTPTTEYLVGARVAMQDTSLNDFVPIEIMILLNGAEVYSESFNVDPAMYGGYEQIIFDTPIAVQTDDVVDYLAVDSDGEARFLEGGNSDYQIGLLATFDGSNVMSGPFLEAPILMELIVCEDLNQCSILSTIDYDLNIGSLKQNFPNPFDENTMIQFSLTSNEVCLFEIRDVTGKLVKSMDLGIQNAGQHQIELKSAEFGEGIYFYTLTAGKQKMTKKMVVLK